MLITPRKSGNYQCIYHGLRLTLCLGYYMLCCYIASFILEGWYKYYVAFVYVHSRHTTAPMPSKIPNDRAFNFSYTYLQVTLC